jgi:hypothetical protein
VSSSTLLYFVFMSACLQNPTLHGELKGKCRTLSSEDSYASGILEEYCTRNEMTAVHFIFVSL